MVSRMMTPFGGRGLMNRGDPFLDLHREMNRLFDDTFRGMGGGSPGQGTMMGIPRLDVHEAGEQLEISAELPGVKQENVDIELEGDILTISGEKRQDHEDKKAHFVERSYGSFSRSIQLPFQPDPDQVNADFENGVLRITLPRQGSQDRSRRIQIGHGKGQRTIEGGATQNSGQVSAASSGQSGGDDHDQGHRRGRRQRQLGPGRWQDHQNGGTALIRAIMGGAMFAAAAFLTSAAAQANDDYVYGPQPDWADYKAMGEAALRAQLPNPASWKVEWPYGYVQGKWKHKGSHQGYMTCGLLRTDTPVDGRAVIQFLTVIDHGRVRIADIGQKDPKTVVNYWCGLMISKGVLTPASERETAELPIARLGLTIRPMPEGAYVVSAADGMPAKIAGVRPGMVLTRANGISLVGMGAAMGKLLESDAPSWTFETAMGESIEVRRTP